MSSQNCIYLSCFKQNMLENEAKYNNETSTIHYVGIVQFV